MLDEAYALARRFVGGDDRLRALHSVGIELVFPPGIGGENEQFFILSRFRDVLCRFLAEHIRVIREQLEIGADLVPVGGDHEVIDLLLFCLFVPLRLGVVAGDGFVAQEQTFLRRLKDEIFGQIGLDAALRRVDLKPGENSESFGAFAAFLPVCVGTVLIVGDDAEAQRRVADLPLTLK